jgi:sodium transport system ATP-binding protein
LIEIKSLSKAFRLTKQHRRELGKSFKDKKTIQAVNDISFTCKPGQIFGLIGPNGAGKTTTLRMVATMLKPTKGSIIVCGYDTVHHNQQVRKQIGFMTGQTALYDRLTPNEMVQYMAELHGMNKEKFLKRREKLFDILDMHDFSNRRIARLSTGMKQKTSIARTIIHDPEVMVFDEPTSGLDVMSSRAIMNLIRSCKDDGKTVLFSTHRMGEINQVCDDLAIIYKGKLFFNGSLEQFKSEMTQPTFEDEFVFRVEEN